MNDHIPSDNHYTMTPCTACLYTTEDGAHLRRPRLCVQHNVERIRMRRDWESEGDMARQCPAASAPCRTGAGAAEIVMSPRCHARSFAASEIDDRTRAAANDMMEDLEGATSDVQLWMWRRLAFDRREQARTAGVRTEMLFVLVE